MKTIKKTPSLFISLMFLIFLSGSIFPAVSASADIAYVLKNPSNPDQNFLNVLRELNLNYDLIDDSDISSTNFSNYRMIIVRERISNLPVNSYNSLIVSPDYYDGWSNTRGSLASNHPLRARNINANSSITKDMVGEFQVYTTGGSLVPIYYLMGKKYNVKGITTTLDSLGEFVIATKENPRRVFFGITESQYWTENSRKLFKNSIKWIIEGEDRDGDGFFGDLDCNDNDATINPNATEIPYDGIDNNCDGFDLLDVDEDGYCNIGYQIQNKALQCQRETGNIGTDCNDNDATINPSSTDSLKNCINEAPIRITDIPTQIWDEDNELTLDLNAYFSDPDGDDLTYMIYDTSSDLNITVEIIDSSAYFSSVLEWFGSDWVIFKAADTNGLYVLSNRINLIVNSVNDAPVLEHIEDIYVIEGQMVEIIANASDVDNIGLNYSINDSRFNKNENIFTWQTSIGNGGIYSVIIRVEDGNGGSDSQQVSIEVLSKILVNEFVSNPPDVGSDLNDWIEIYNPGNLDFNLSNCEIKDGADNFLNLSGLLSKKGFLVFEWSNRLNNAGDIIKLYCYEELVDSVTYGDWDDGNTQDNACSDSAPGHGESCGRELDGKDTNNDMEDFILFYAPTKGLPNNADVILPIVELLAPLDRAFFNDTRDINFEFRVTDDKAEQLECEIHINGVVRGLVSVENATIINILVDDLVDGSYIWNVRCRDGTNEGSGINNWSFEISAPDNPILNPISDKTINENQTLEFTISAIDSDDDNISLSAENLPAGASFVDNLDGTGDFSWTPTYEQAGDYYVKFVVEDSTGLKDEDTVRITVKNVKQPPKFSDIDLCEKIDYELEIEIREPDDGDDFEIGGIIEGEIKVENNADEKLDIKLEIYFYDIDEEEKIEKVKKDVGSIKKGKDEKVEFELEIPDKIDDEDEFVIFVKAEGENDKDYCNQEFIYIEIERQKHRVIIKEIEIIPELVSPGSNIEVGVKIENIGTNNEDIYIQIENQELNISQRSDEFEIEEYGEDDTETKRFFVEIPKDAEEKSYEIKASVFYDAGDDSETKTFTVMEKAEEEKTGFVGAIQTVQEGIIRLGKGVGTGLVINILEQPEDKEKKEIKEESVLNKTIKESFNLNSYRGVVNITLVLGIALVLFLIIVIVLVRKS